MTDKLKAGPELDARIATEVMGWTDFVMGWVDNKTDPDHWACLKDVWRPSTDIADAWRILERLQPPSRADAWVEFVHSWVGALHLSHMKASEAAFAICRAALQDRENGDA